MVPHANAVAEQVDDGSLAALDATVTVMFNRPVVALTAIEDQGDLPQPLAFPPPGRAA